MSEANRHYPSQRSQGEVAQDEAELNPMAFYIQDQPLVNLLCKMIRHSEPDLTSHPTPQERMMSNKIRCGVVEKRKNDWYQGGLEDEIAAAWVSKEWDYKVLEHEAIEIRLYADNTTFRTWPVPGNSAGWWIIYKEQFYCLNQLEFVNYMLDTVRTAEGTG